MRIESAKWGKITMEDGSVYKDVKIHPLGHREWDWKETNTKHRPGIQISDLKELLENEAKILVLSKGYDCELHTTQEAEDYLNGLEVSYYILDTKKAVDKYNEIYDSGEMVGALIHSTC